MTRLPPKCTTKSSSIKEAKDNLSLKKKKKKNPTEYIQISTILFLTQLGYLITRYHVFLFWTPLQFDY